MLFVINKETKKIVKIIHPLSSSYEEIINDLDNELYACYEADEAFKTPSISDDGEVTDEAGEKPSEYHIWDEENSEWTIPDEKQTELETTAFSQLAAYRYAIQSGTLFESGDFTSSGSTNSYLYVDQTYNKIAEGTILDTRWKNADGRTWVTLDADSLSDFKSLRDNLSSFVDKCFKTEEQVQIELLADLEIDYKTRFDTILLSL